MNNKRKEHQYNDIGIIKVLTFLKEQIRKQFPCDRAVENYLKLLYTLRETDFIKKAYPGDALCIEYVISERGLFRIFDYEQLKLTRKISIIAIVIAIASVISTLI